MSVNRPTRTRVRVVAASGAVLALLGTAAACGSDSDGGSAADGADVKVGYISPVGSQPGQQEVSTGLDQAGDELGWDVTVLDANLSADKQVSHVDTLLTQGVKAIGSWSLDANAVAGAYSKARSQDVPVVGVNSVGEGVSGTVWWEISTCEDGGPHEQTAAWIAERKPGARVFVFGGPPVEAIENNVKCFTAAAEAAGLTVVGRADNTNDNSAAASTLAADVLTKNDDIDAFWSYNDSTALGISAALENAGESVYSDSNPDGVMDFGLNGDAEAIQAIEDGRLTATWDPDTVATGFAVIKAMKEAMDDPSADLPDMVVESQMFTEDNVADWVPAKDRAYTLDSIPLAGS